MVARMKNYPFLRSLVAIKQKRPLIVRFEVKIAKNGRLGP